MWQACYNVNEKCEQGGGGGSENIQKVRTGFMYGAFHRSLFNIVGCKISFHSIYYSHYARVALIQNIAHNLVNAKQ